MSVGGGSTSLITKHNEQYSAESRRSKRRLPLTAFAFSLQYAFYQAYFRDFPGGPVGAAVRTAGANVQTVSICILILFALGVVCCFNTAWMQLVYRRRGLKLFLLICAFLLVMLLPLTPYVWLIYTLSILGAFCAGTIMGRSLYTAMFLSIGIHPARLVVAVYAVFQSIYTLFQLIPALHTIPMYYAVGAPMFFAALAFFFPYDGDEMERKRVLPENKLRLSAIWPPLVFIILAQLSFAYYEVMLLPIMAEQPLDQILRIIPNAVVLIALFVFGQKIKIRSVLVIYAVVFALAVLAFLTDMSKSAAYMVTEPAYRFYDLFFFWLLLSSFRMYGRNNSRLKLFISIDVALGVVVIMLAQLLLPLLPPGMVGAIPLFVIVVGTFLLIPKVEQTIKNMDAQGEYAESRSEREVPLPDQREDILEARDALLRTLPAGVTLTAGEQTALAYMIDGQDADVTAHYMDISVGKANALIGGIAAKFGCTNKNELIAIISAARAGIEQRERMRRLLETDGLTQDEKDVALLLIEGETRRDISRKLRLTADDTGRRITAIRDKISGVGDPDPVISDVAGKYKLTGSETKVFRLLRDGNTNPQIAAELVLAEETVKRHVRNLMRKLPIENRKQIPAWLETIDERIEHS